MKEETKKKISEKLKNRVFTEEHKRKLSIALKGKKRPFEIMERVRLANIGRKHTESHKIKVGLAVKGEKNGMFGKTHTIEAREKISKSKIGKHIIRNIEKTGTIINCMECGKERYVEKSIIKNNPKREFFCCLDCKIENFRKNSKYFLMKHRKEIIFPVKDTSIEIKIQNFLKQLNIDFFTHQYIKEIEHGYQCDILIPSMNLVIECDGDYWHKYPIGKDIDHIRTSELIEKGFKVLRLWEFEIKQMDLEDFKGVLKI